MKRLVIVGAGGHGRETLDVVRSHQCDLEDMGKSSGSSTTARSYKNRVDRRAAGVNRTNEDPRGQR